MGQAPIKDNIFRDGILYGFCLDGVSITKIKPYPKGLNYGLIIKPLYLEMKFRLPIMMYFNGLPYHVGVRISNASAGIDEVFSFCPDLREPHRGTLLKDIRREVPKTWLEESELCETFWIANMELNPEISPNLCACKSKERLCKVYEDVPTDTHGTVDVVGVMEPTLYDKITARLIDLINLNSIGLDEYNRRHGLTLNMSYNLLTNNCTNLALGVLIGKNTCYQIDYIKPIIMAVLKSKEVISQLPEYSKMWISDFYDGL